MRIRSLGILVRGTIFCATLCFLGHSQTQGLSDATWSLPHGLAVKDGGPRTYRFTVDYTSANTKGEIFQRQRLAGKYTRGLPGGEVTWKNVTEASANGATAPFGVPQKRDFMEGLRYRDSFDITMPPDFFKGFPPTAVMERNLVWDTGMIEISARIISII